MIFSNSEAHPTHPGSCGDADLIQWVWGGLRTHLAGELQGKRCAALRTRSRRCRRCLPDRIISEAFGKATGGHQWRSRDADVT